MLFIRNAATSMRFRQSCEFEATSAMPHNHSKCWRKNGTIPNESTERRPGRSCQAGGLRERIVELLPADSPASEVADLEDSQPEEPRSLGPSSNVVKVRSDNAFA